MVDASLAGETEAGLSVPRVTADLVLVRRAPGFRQRV